MGIWWLYKGYSESNLHLFLATNVDAGESSHMQQRHMTQCLVKHHMTGHLAFVLVSTD
jgi:hypothetical protein